MTRPRSFLLAAFAACTLASVASGAHTPWPTNAFVRKLVDDALPRTSGRFDGVAYARRGTRSASYTALGLLWRGGRKDRAAASAILRELVLLQHDDGPGEKKHGVWRTRATETKVDYNWREFVGSALIVILEEFGDRLDAALVEDINDALLRAAQGAKQRNVGAGYTNIAIMSSFLMDYVGTRRGRPDLQDLGRRKAQEIFKAYYRHNTFDEYNSPTYYGVNLAALGMWRKHATWNRMREMGAQMEADLWRDIVAFYHPGMKNMCGPFVRAYGMDMTEYVAITGLWIGMALGDSRLAPLPATRGRKGFERDYAPVIAILGCAVPREVLPRLAGFRGGARTLKRVCSRGTVTALIDERLMMGAMQLKRRWDQHFPATVYWKAGVGGLGWIMLYGTSEHVAPVVVGRELRMTRTRSSKDPLLLYVGAPNIGEDQISGKAWRLPGMVFAATGAKGAAVESVKKVDHKWFGACLEVKVRAPAGSTFTLRPMMR